MKLQFDPSQGFQIAAVESVVRVFEDLPFTGTEGLLSIEGGTIANLPVFEER